MAILKRGLHLFGPIFRRLWPWLVFSVGIRELVLFYLGIVTDPQNDTDRILVALISMCLQVGLAVMTGVFVMIAARDEVTGRKTSLWHEFQQKLKLLTVESLRTILPILLKSLLLVIPGILEYLRLSMILFIVMLDPEYQAGKVDALERSRTLTRGRIMFVLIFMLVTAALELPASWLQSQKLLAQPFYYCPLFLLSVLGTCYSNVVYYCVYETLISNDKLRGG